MEGLSSGEWKQRGRVHHLLTVLPSITAFHAESIIDIVTPRARWGSKGHRYRERLSVPLKKFDLFSGFFYSFLRGSVGSAIFSSVVTLRSGAHKREFLVPL
eukprot:Selendium_serpulae@DN5787_c0_g1_i10.p1